MSNLIDRDAAIDAIEITPFDDYGDYMRAKELIEQLPSTQLHTKGRWIGTDYDGFADGNPVYDEWKCSECGCVIEDEEPTWNFCPFCGSDMRGDEGDQS